MTTGHPESSMIDAKLEEHRISASRSCPSCGHKLDGKPEDMVGLPAGVKFDPTDQELIEHLETKVMDGGSRAHPLIDEFIPTIQGEDGICYTHPEKLPGVTRDGLSKHFFHRPSKAYTTGTRKRRKIHAQCDLPSSKNGCETRWHKTGKTRPLMVAGRLKGCKKILVLYTNFGKHRKPEKTNWVMHQYHLGDLEDEKDGELIVSKVFYKTQPRQSVAVAGTVDKDATIDTTAETPGELHDGVFGYAVAAAAAVQVQRQQVKQADGRFSSSPPFKKMHEVSADHQVTIDQGKQHDHHHMPSEHHVSPNLQSKPETTVRSSISKPVNLASITTPTIRHVSAVLNNQLHSPMMLVRDENIQMNNVKEKELHEQQKFDQRSAGLEELIMACQSASTKEGTSAHQSQEAQWPYQYWPPDNQDQHG